MATVRGSVRDSADAPISYATIAWGEPSQSLRSDDAGAFEIVGLRPGPTKFTIRRLGFTPVEFELALRAGVTKPVVVNMTSIPQNLAIVSVERTSEANPDPRSERFLWTGFLERQAQHRGYFIGPEEIERRRPNYISDLMFTVPGVVMVGRPHSRAVKYLSSVGQCPLKLYLDGNAAPEGDDWVAGSDIKAVEVYANSMNVPSAFMPSQLKGYCGSIVIWTK
ncbi:MAG: carboxypeptidase-like regulatory domain-containing protein [Gemmatimonadota bacterium]|nr:carboxypeptidase-like regulatory domain-containing protein [Gemmatimonadota bacterium]